MIRRFFYFLIILFFVSLCFIAILTQRFKPAVLENRAEAFLGRYFHGKVHSESFSLKWDGLTPLLELENVEIIPAGKERPILSAAKATIRARALNLLSTSNLMKIEEITFQDAKITCERSEHGDWSWNKIFAVNAAPPNVNESSSRLAFAVKFKNLDIDYEDRSALPTFRTKVSSADAVWIPARSGGYHVFVDFHDSKSTVSSIRIRYLSSRFVIYAYFRDKGSVKILLSDPWRDARWSAVVRVKGMPLKDTPSIFQNLSGNISLKIEANSDGLHPEVFKRNLIVKGAVSIEDGGYGGSNWVKDILSQLSELPGFSGVSRNRFEGNLHQIADLSDTLFKTAQFDIQAEKEYVRLLNFRMTHPVYRFYFDAEENRVRGDWELKGSFYCTGSFAKELLRRAEGAEVLLNHDQEIEIPFTSQVTKKNRTKAVRLVPDLQFVADRLIQARGNELTSRGIQKINQFLEAKQS